MSKKDKIVEMLEKGSNTEDICTELEVSTGYVYRIKREIDESGGNTENNTETKNIDANGLVIDSTSGDSVNVEGNNENLEDQERKRKTDKTNRVGGVKKRKKRTKKSSEQSSEQGSEHKSTEQNSSGGIIKWLKRTWKKTLLILTSLILLIILMLSSYRTKQKEDTQVPESRYPILRY